jgi:predicted protein tyrosine phosphatase
MAPAAAAQRPQADRPMRLLCQNIFALVGLLRAESPNTLERFQAKQIPVRVEKTHKNKKLENFHVSMKRENALGIVSRAGRRR